MTLRSLFRELVIAQERLIDETNRATTMAWQVEAFRRMRKFPALKDVLMKKAKTLEQQVTETMANLSVVTGRDPVRVRLVRRPLKAS